MYRKFLILLVLAVVSGCVATPPINLNTITTLQEFDKQSRENGNGIWRRWEVEGYKVIGWKRFLRLPYYAVFDEQDKLIEYLGYVNGYVNTAPIPDEIPTIRAAKHRAKERETAANIARTRAEIAELEQEYQSASKPLVCVGLSACKKAFSLTQVFISERADVRIQIATDTIIETYGPKDYVTMKAKKIPAAGSMEEISLQVGCKENPSSAYTEEDRLTLFKMCRKSQIAYLKDFSSYLTIKMPELQR